MNQKSPHAHERVIRQEVYREIDQNLTPGTLYGPDDIWSLMHYEIELFSPLCLLRKPIQQLARKHANDWTAFEHEVNRLLVALSEVDPEVRELEIQALQGGWSREHFSWKVEELVRRHAATLIVNVPNVTTTQSSYAQNSSNRQRKAMVKSARLVRRLFAGERPNMNLEEL
jgi:hypothetical protein